MTAKEVIAALRSTPSRSKRELFDTAADMIEAAMDKPVVSNADRIRAMSDEELAIGIHAVTLGWRGQSAWCDFGCNNPRENGCDKCILKWLKQPAKEDT